MINISQIKPKTITKTAGNAIELAGKSGLTKVLRKKAALSAEFVKEEFIKRSSSNGIVGNLPSEWIKLIPKNEREVKIKGLYNDFKEIIIDLRKKGDIKKASEQMTDALKKAEIIQKHENLSLNYLKEGEHCKGYSLDGISDDKFMIRVFHDRDYLGKFSKDHGNYIEIARAGFWQKNAGKNQFTKFHFGDVDSAYMLDGFIGPKTPEYKGRIVHERIYGLINSDGFSTNIIKGYQVDFGGLEIDSYTLSQNKNARYVYKKLFNAPKAERFHKFLKLYSVKKYQKNPDIKLGLAASIDLLPEKDRTRGFLMLLDYADNSMRHELVDKLYWLPKDDRKIALNKLWNKADEKFKAEFKNTPDRLIKEDQSIIFAPIEEKRESFFKYKIHSFLDYIRLRQLS